MYNALLKFLIREGREAINDLLPPRRKAF